MRCNGWAGDLIKVNKVLKFVRATASAYFRITPIKLEGAVFMVFGESGQNASAVLLAKLKEPQASAWATSWLARWSTLIAALAWFQGVKTLLAPCLNWEAVLRSMFLLIEVFHWTPRLVLGSSYK